MMQKRPPPIRSKTHRLWLGSLACAVPGCFERPEPHHLRKGFLTMSRKPGDDQAVPLCRTHHAECHDKGTQTFEKNHRIDLQRIADTYWTLSPANPRNEGGSGWR